MPEEETWELSKNDKRLLVRALTICIEHDRDRMMGNPATEGIAKRELEILGATMSQTEALLNKITGLDDE